MFIPLTINQENGERKNILIAGDTAGILWILGQLSGYKVNLFLGDTGIKKPLREFPCHKTSTNDKANVYYDFFDDGIGAGIVRRMDACFLTEDLAEKMAPTLKRLNIPTVVIKIRDREAVFEDLVGMTYFGGEEIKVTKPAAAGEQPIETTWSAWDCLDEDLGKIASIKVGDEIYRFDGGKKLIELGIPELDILTIKCKDGVVEYRELTGDLARVFDGIIK